jgi:hypothetical protein
MARERKLVTLKSRRKEYKKNPSRFRPTHRHNLKKKRVLSYCRNNSSS